MTGDEQSWAQLPIPYRMDLQLQLLEPTGAESMDEENGL